MVRCWELLRAVYLPWLENTARHLQQLIHDQRAVGFQARQADRNGGGAARRCLPTDCGWTSPSSWRKGWRLAIESTQDWEWSAIPSVTATAKPAASPIADAVRGR
jgi:hypothetical protein